MNILGKLFGPMMRFCYLISKNYGLAIILFTVITKVVMMPISIWVQKNSIKMVQIEPDVNRIKAKFFGDNDRIADEQQNSTKKQNTTRLHAPGEH